MGGNTSRNAGNNTIHFCAELRTDNSELNNLYIGLTDGDVQRLDMHNSAENGSLLHVMNIFYNEKDKECNSDGDMVYFLSGANNGWTSKSEDKGANYAEFNGKTHGMKQGGNFWEYMFFHLTFCKSCSTIIIENKNRPS